MVWDHKHKKQPQQRFSRGATTISNRPQSLSLTPVLSSNNMGELQPSEELSSPLAQESEAGSKSEVLVPQSSKSPLKDQRCQFPVPPSQTGNISSIPVQALNNSILVTP